MSEVKKEETGKQDWKGKTIVRQGTKQQETVIYIGPSIKNVVSTGTLYSNGLPEALKNEIAKRPLVASLVIPVSNLAAAQKELTVLGSALHTIYQKVATGQED